MNKDKKVPANAGGWRVTNKGRALLAAIEAGLIEETEDGVNIEAFERFWAIYKEKVEPASNGSMTYFLPMAVSLFSLAVCIAGLFLR